MESWREEFYSSDYGSEYLMHHGIKGQKWYRRRYQNEDGSLTEEGKRRYGKGNPNGEFNKARDEGFDKVLDYQESQSKGKKIVKSILFGESGRMTYDMARKLGGQSRLRAAINAAFGLSNLGTMAGSTLSTAITETGFGLTGSPDDYDIDDSGARGSKTKTAIRLATGAAGTVAGRTLDATISQKAKEKKMATSLLQKRLLNQYAEKQLKKKK